MIAQRNLALLYNRVAKGGERRIPESVLERELLPGMVSNLPFRERRSGGGWLSRAGRRSSDATLVTTGFPKTWILRSRAKWLST
jgi:hypothetical protein